MMTTSTTYAGMPEYKELDELYKITHNKTVKFIDYMKMNNYFERFAYDHVNEMRCNMMESELSICNMALLELYNNYDEIVQNIGIELMREDNKYIKAKLIDISLQIKTFEDLLDANKTATCIIAGNL